MPAATAAFARKFRREFMLRTLPCFTASWGRDGFVSYPVSVRYPRADANALGIERRHSSPGIEQPSAGAHDIGQSRRERYRLAVANLPV
jgi:hypothetical protein